MSGHGSIETVRSLMFEDETEAARRLAALDRRCCSEESELIEREGNAFRTHTP